MKTPLTPFQAYNFIAYEKIIKHGFFTRNGGYSTGIYSSLNIGLSKNDDPKNVIHNRRKIANHFEKPLEQLCFSNQIQGNKPLYITKPYDPLTPPQTDALITDTPGLIIAVQTADCVPILVCDPNVPIVAAIHAGWRGALTGIIENTINLMVKKGALPERMIANIGPAIYQESYEVDDNFYKTFQKQNKKFETYFKPSRRESKYHFDLRGFVHHKLSEIGIRNIGILHNNTYEQSDLFFSCRRATHNNEPSFGNQSSCIMIK